MGATVSVMSRRWPGDRPRHETCQESSMRKTMLTASAALIALASTSFAQEWPSHPITLVIPFAAGGGLDVSVRIQAQPMSELSGQTSVAENVDPAGGTDRRLPPASASPHGNT